MLPDRLREILRGFRWIPEDYARVLAEIETGRRRYGVEWFDGPQAPASMAGTRTSNAFTSAFWIGRRDGHFLGYDETGSGRPVLCEWRGWRRRPARRFAGIDQLILSQIDPAADRRPKVRFDLAIEGMAFDAWRFDGTGLSALCLLSPGRESLGVGNLLDRMAPGWELTLVCEDNDSWLSVRKGGAEFELERSRHGSAGAWRAVTRIAAFGALVALAPSNGGASAWNFGRLRVPKPTHLA
jgi:hypothetical protein